MAKCRNAGQVCTAASRFYVQRSLVEAFTERLAARMAGLRIGPGSDPGTEIGPLISAAQRERVHGLVADALARGARLVTGGEPRPGQWNSFGGARVSYENEAGSGLGRRWLSGTTPTKMANAVAFGSD